MTGEQRYHQIRTKVRIIAARQLRDFMASKIPVLPCSGDLERELICRELDRISPEPARRALEPKP